MDMSLINKELHRKLTLLRTFLVGVVLTATMTVNSTAQSWEDNSPLETTLLESVSGIVSFFSSEGSGVWPGFDLSSQPFIVYIPGKWVLAVNFNVPVEGFEPYPEEWPSLGTDALVHYGSYGSLSGQLEFGYMIGDIETVAIGFPEDYYEPLDTLRKLEIFAFIIHESFHQYQRQNFGEIPWSREEKYPLLDPENTSLAALEMKILADAVEAISHDEAERVKELTDLFCAVRKARWGLPQTFIAKYEQGQELNEGTAKYTEVKSMLTMKESIDAHPERYTEAIRDIIAVADITCLTDAINGRMTGNTVAPDDMIRNRIYPVGAAQGFLLDYLGAGWKKEAEQAGSDYKMHAILTSCLNPTGLSDGHLLEKAKSDYEYPKVKRSTEDAIGRYLEEYNVIMTQFQKQDAIKLQLRFGYKSLKRSGSSRAKKWVINEGTESFCSDYRLFRIETESLELDIQNSGILMVNNWDEKSIELLFFRNIIDRLEIDGMSTNPGKTLDTDFAILLIEGPDFLIIFKKKGHIRISEASVLVMDI